MCLKMPADSANEDKPKQLLGLSGTQTIGSALAAVTSALVGSFLRRCRDPFWSRTRLHRCHRGRGSLCPDTRLPAATVALRKIPQRRRGGLPADDGDVLAATLRPKATNLEPNG